MIIILKKIPVNTTESHIEAFINPVLKGGLFKASGQIERISFWRCEIIETNTIEYYVLVDIEPDAVGRRVINQLNKKLLNGKYIAVQEYHARHWSNDKRLFQSVLNRGDNNKRKMDRRRKMTKTEWNSKTGSSLIDDITISTHSNIWNDPNKNSK